MTLLLKSSGLSSYLVGAQEAFYLFHEDLHEGRLVATTLDRTFHNLKAAPPIFDSADVLRAALSPSIAEPSEESLMHDFVAHNMAADDNHHNIAEEPSGEEIQMDLD